jgi:hypothetical protein
MTVQDLMDRLRMMPPNAALAVEVPHPSGYGAAYLNIVAASASLTEPYATIVAR